MGRIKDLGDGLRTKILERIKSRVGAMMVQDMERSFDRQRRGGVAWPPRHVPNIPGILEDLKTSANVKPHRFQARPALVDRGHLRGRINWKSAGPDSIEVGSNLNYASLHNRGGESAVTVSETQRKNLAKFLKSGKGAAGRLVKIYTKKDISGEGLTSTLAGQRTREQEKARRLRDVGTPGEARARLAELRAALGWLFRRDKFVVTVPARPFVTITDNNRKEIKIIVNEEVIRG